MKFFVKACKKGVQPMKKKCNFTAKYLSIVLTKIKKEHEESIFDGYCSCRYDICKLW